MLIQQSAGVAGRKHIAIEGGSVYPFVEDCVAVSRISVDDIVEIDVVVIRERHARFAELTVV